MITYPKNIKTDKDKLFALYLLIEQARLWRNQEGARVRSNPELKGKWLTYIGQLKLLHESPCWKSVLPLYRERNKLRKAIRTANFPTLKEWKSLSEPQKFDASETMFGDRQEIVKGIQLKDKLRISSTSFDWLKEQDFITLQGIVPPDPLENWSTYVEDDTAGCVTVADNTLTIVNFERDSESFVYKDFGAGHFPIAFTNPHLVSAEATAIETSSEFGFWGLSNAVTLYVEAGESDPGIGVHWWDVSGDRMRFAVVDGAVDDQDYTAAAGVAINTQYWLTINLANPSICIIYDDEPRTSEVDTLSIDQSATTMRYMHNVFSRTPGASGNLVGGWVYDLDIQEAAAGWGGEYCGVAVAEFDGVVPEEITGV